MREIEHFEAPPGTETFVYVDQAGWVRVVRSDGRTADVDVWSQPAARQLAEAILRVLS